MSLASWQPRLSEEAPAEEMPDLPGFSAATLGQVCTSLEELRNCMLCSASVAHLQHVGHCPCSADELSLYRDRVLGASVQLRGSMFLDCKV